MSRLIILALSIIVLAGCGPGYVKTPTPAPDSDAIIAQAVAQIAIDASTADRNEAHPSPTPAPTATPIPPSETERIVKTAAWPVALSVTCAGTATMLIVVAMLWDVKDKRRAEIERQRMAVEVATSQIPELKAVLESLREYQQSADVTPRNTEENENGE